MDLRVRYFALVSEGRRLADAYNIFRELRDAEGYSLERLDLTDPNNWVDDAAGLAGYVLRGEPGAYAITEEEARKFIESRGGKFSPPDLQP
jgi:hypothetical protein